MAPSKLYLYTSGSVSGYEERFKDWSKKDCRVALTKLEEKLEEIGPVNLKAQYLLSSVTDKKDALESRVKEYKESLKMNEAVLEQLMGSKDEKVEFTFSQVAKYFSEVFTILVPNGHARLVFERYTQSQTTQANNRPSAIRIQVSFNGNDQVAELNALSGGQKSIVALAYMFALQKCDPCPIYVFDEIDANLDLRSRKAIANWLINCKEGLNEDQEPPQFITTTFRRELMERADKIIGVTMVRKASKIRELDRQEGLDFITEFSLEGN